MKCKVIVMIVGSLLNYYWWMGEFCIEPNQARLNLLSNIVSSYEDISRIGLLSGLFVKILDILILYWCWMCFIYLKFSMFKTIMKLFSINIFPFVFYDWTSVVYIVIQASNLCDILTSMIIILYIPENKYVLLTM